MNATSTIAAIISSHPLERRPASGSQKLLVSALAIAYGQAKKRRA